MKYMINFSLCRPTIAINGYRVNRAWNYHLFLGIIHIQIRKLRITKINRNRR